MNDKTKTDHHLNLYQVLEQLKWFRDEWHFADDSQSTLIVDAIEMFEDELNEEVLQHDQQ